VLGTNVFRTVLVQESFRTVLVQKSSCTVLIQQSMSTVRIQVMLVDVQKQLKSHPKRVQSRCHVCHERRDECRSQFE
jgi:hypothetical protein